MKTLFPILLFLFVLFFISCESTHSGRKLIVNNTDFDLFISYSNYCCPSDSILHLPANDHIYIVQSIKLGNHPDGLPTSPCSISELDTVFVSVNSIIPYSFIGDFRDEYRWEESISGKRNTVQLCTFTITNEDIVP
jgi:hypothetical protein